MNFVDTWKSVVVLACLNMLQLKWRDLTVLQCRWRKYCFVCIQGLQKLLNSRQLGLKLIANVTFGYTSANFSGRMPCVEVRTLFLWLSCANYSLICGLFNCLVVWYGSETLANETSAVMDYLKRYFNFCWQCDKLPEYSYDRHGYVRRPHIPWFWGSDQGFSV